MDCAVCTFTEHRTLHPSHLEGLKLVVDVLAKDGDVEEVEGLGLGTVLPALIGSLPKSHLLPQQGEVGFVCHNT